MWLRARVLTVFNRAKQMGFGDVNNVLFQIKTYLFSWFEIESLVILSVLLSAAADERLHWRLLHIHID